MKQFILATALLIMLSSASFAKAGNKNKKMLRDLTTTMQSGQVSSAVLINGEFRRNYFIFNGKKVSAYYDMQTNELIGFAIPISANELPSGAKEDIEKKYKDYSVSDVILFIYKTGFYGFYVSVKHPGERTVVLDINKKGKAHYYTYM